MKNRTKLFSAICVCVLITSVLAILNCVFGSKRNLTIDQFVDTQQIQLIDQQIDQQIQFFQTQLSNPDLSAEAKQLLELQIKELEQQKSVVQQQPPVVQQQPPVVQQPPPVVQQQIQSQLIQKLKTNTPVIIANVLLIVIGILLIIACYFTHRISKKYIRIFTYIIEIVLIISYISLSVSTFMGEFSILSSSNEKLIKALPILYGSDNKIIKNLAIPKLVFGILSAILISIFLILYHKQRYYSYYYF